MARDINKEVTCPHCYKKHLVNLQTDDDDLASTKAQIYVERIENFRTFLTPEATEVYDRRFTRPNPKVCVICYEEIPSEKQQRDDYENQTPLLIVPGYVKPEFKLLMHHEHASHVDPPTHDLELRYLAPVYAIPMMSERIVVLGDPEFAVPEMYVRAVANIVNTLAKRKLIVGAVDASIIPLAFVDVNYRRVVGVGLYTRKEMTEQMLNDKLNDNVFSVEGEVAKKPNWEKWLAFVGESV